MSQSHDPDAPAVVTRHRHGLDLFATGRAARPLPLSEAQKGALSKLGVETVQDLLQYYPRRHVDRTQLRTIAALSDLSADDMKGEITILARVKSMNEPFQLKARNGKKMKLVKGTLQDETGTIEVTWFNQVWVPRALPVGSEAFFFGKVRRFGRKMQMSAPRFEKVQGGKEPYNVGRIVPRYPATAEVTTDQIRKAVWDVLGKIGPIADPLPLVMQAQVGLMDRGDAIRKIHFPETIDDVMNARRRIAFDEVLTIQLGLVYRKRKIERTVRGIQHASPGQDSLAEAFVEELPFRLTAAQRRACAEVAEDLSKAHPMHRLLEGEVGSGKTVVALYACLISIDGGHQAAFMAPTEVLAEQHHLTVNDLLDRAFGEHEGRNLFAANSRRPVVRLLTGSTPAARRTEILNEVASGEVDLLIGTHALIQEGVEFKSLGVAIVDEQHRFGVHQRKRLREKGNLGEPDILVMTATPIPRTLAVSIFGDLDLSTLDELPAGRKPISTTIVADAGPRKKAYDLIRSEVAAGRQAFIVYALRDESDKTELRSAKAEAVRLGAEVFPDLSVGLVHGDMKSDEKDAAMSAFRDGTTDVLVATTVVEVGVDVPNATVMMIEDADRFGIAQLHQLRGRVGRGRFDSHCFLATEVELKRADDDSAVKLVLDRLEAVAGTNDGFKLADFDLRQRGEGDLFGARQSGLPALKMTRVFEHMAEIKQARDLAIDILTYDPELEAYEHQELAREMRERFPEQALDVVQSG